MLKKTLLTKDKFEMRRNVIVILLLTLMVFGAACKPTEVPPVEHERSYLHILSASQAVGNFDLSFDYWNTEGQVIPDFYYKRNWPLGGYSNLVAGGTPDEFGNGQMFILATQQPFINVDKDTVMAPKPIVLEPNTFSTLCIVDSGGTLAITHITDNFTNPGAEANVRLINLQAMSGAVGLRSTDGNINIPSVSYRDASDFMRVPEGTYDIEVMDETGSTVLTTWNGITVGKGVTYSFYVSGPGSSSSDVAVFVH